MAYPTRLEDERDVVWLAGLLEGEGTFDLHRGRYPRVRVGMTDRDVIGRAATLMGTGVRLTLRKSPAKSTWHAEITGANAVAVMHAVLKHMGARRSAKIAEVLAEYRLRNAPGNASLPGPKPSRPPGLPL